MTDQTDTTNNTDPSVAPQGDHPARPDWLPEQFTDGPALLQSYKDLQAELTRLKQGAKPNDAPPSEVKGEGASSTDQGEKAKEGEGDKKPAEKPEPKIKPAESYDEAALQAAEAQLAKQAQETGVDVDAYVTEFTEAGELSEDSYSALEAKGFPRSVVNEFIAARLARTEALVGALVEEVGGRDKLQLMLDWAAANWTPEDHAKYEEARTSKDWEKARQAVLGLKAQYEKANGSEPSVDVTSQGTAPASLGDIFATHSEFQKAIEDPRYGNPAHRDYSDEVIAKYKRSFSHWQKGSK